MDRTKLAAFLFPSETDRWLVILRLGLGVQVVLYALSLCRDWNYLLAGTGHGLISRDLAEKLLSLESPLVPRFGWLVALGNYVGLTEETVLQAAWVGLLTAGCGLIAGLFCRSSAILAWFLHLCAAKSGGLVSYGADNFMTIGLFYLMLSPLPDRFSLDRQWRRQDRQAQQSRNSQDRSELLGFWRRVLQVHLCLIYFFGGLSKALGSGWWNGANLWLALTRPPFDLIPAEAVIRWKYLLPVAGIAVVILEMGYPLFIWYRGTRSVWLIGIMAMHAAIGLAMGMYLFSLVMIVLNLSAFGPELIWIFRTELKLKDEASDSVPADPA